MYAEGAAKQGEIWIHSIYPQCRECRVFKTENSGFLPRLYAIRKSSLPPFTSRLESKMFLYWPSQESLVGLREGTVVYFIELLVSRVT